MSVIVFPGQGAQYRGMGSGLFEAFSDLTQSASEILGTAVDQLCLEDPDHLLGQTEYTQPALFVVNSLMYMKRCDEFRPPDFVAGHSLGEYNALVAAGVLDFETGVRLVKRRGELMGRARGGAMAAVIGLGRDRVAEILERQQSSLTVANDNSPTQVVIAGSKGEIEKAAAYFEEPGVGYIPLNVSGAFHSAHMRDAAEAFRDDLAAVAFSKPSVPVVSNVLAAPHVVEDIGDNMVSQMTSPVRWTESIRYLLGQGEHEFIEVGPGRVLTKLVQAIVKDTETARPLVPSLTVVGDGAARPSSLRTASRAKASTQTLVEQPRQRITAEGLGDQEFKKDYGVDLAYLSGSMYRGVSSVDMVVRMARAGMMGFFGSGGLPLAKVERAIVGIRHQLRDSQSWGVNLLHFPGDAAREEAMVDLLIKHRVRVVEASAFTRITPALVRFRAQRLRRGPDGKVEAELRIIGKVSRSDVAEAFLSPAPTAVVESLVGQGKLTETQARLLREVPVADDLCAEADSGGHTDGAVAYAITPAMLTLRDELKQRHGYAQRVRVGAAGGIGTPEAAAAAFVLGADFVLTGSINHCTVEAATSAAVKDLLQQMEVQDTDYAPAGDMFELGAKVQVLRRGLFFAARANRMYELYRSHEALDEIDSKTRAQLERYFGRTIDEVYEDVKAHHPRREVEKAEQSPKHKMALVFRWYFARTNQLALEGSAESKVDYQIHCGPALGAFNQWVKGTALENWRNRHVDEIGIKLMTETADILNRRFECFAAAGSTSPRRQGDVPTRDAVSGEQHRRKESVHANR